MTIYFINSFRVCFELQRRSLYKPPIDNVKSLAIDVKMSFGTPAVNSRGMLWLICPLDVLLTYANMHTFINKSLFNFAPRVCLTLQQLSVNNIYEVSILFTRLNKSNITANSRNKYLSTPTLEDFKQKLRIW